MATLTLNEKKLLELAQDDKVNTAYWAKVMHESRMSRDFFNSRFNHFQNHRYWIEMSVKAVVTVTLGVGLFFVAPSTLLYGAALTLTISSLVFSNINLRTHTITVPEENGFESSNVSDNFNKDKWEKYRAKWCAEAQNHGLTESQKALHTNMTRVGMAIVISFAAYTAIASGIAVPLCISSVLFAGSLFHRNIDAPAPYLEKENALPELDLPLHVEKNTESSQFASPANEEEENTGNPPSVSSVNEEATRDNEGPALTN